MSNPKVIIGKSLLKKMKTFPFSVKKMDIETKAMIRCLKCPGGPWDIGIMLTCEDHVHKLNKKYRKKDKPTDILSFPYHKITVPGRFPKVRSRDECYLGDIFICVPYVIKQCEVEQWQVEERMKILLAHGICHLMGYDHEKDDEYERMQKAEDFLLKKHEEFLFPQVLHTV